MAMLLLKRLSFFFLLFTMACSSTQKLNQTLDPIMHFDPLMMDLGVVKKGETKTMIFPFVNSGKNDIEIEIATGCQCSEIIAPIGRVFKSGEKGEVKVVFHSDLEEDLGAMTKVIDIYLVQIDPSNGYQILKEVKYKFILEE